MYFLYNCKTEMVGQRQGEEITFLNKGNNIAITEEI